MDIVVVGIILCGLLSLIYLVIKPKENEYFNVFFRAIIGFVYVIVALFVFYKNSNEIWSAYGFIIAGLVLSLISNMYSEKTKDKTQQNENLSLSALFLASSKIMYFISLLYIINVKIMVVPTILAGVFALIFSAITVFVLKAFSVNTRGQNINILCYMFISTYMFFMALWHSFVVGWIVFFVVFAGLLLMDDILLLKVNYGKKHKMFLYIERVVYYIAQIMLLLFIYYGLFEYFSF